MAYCIVTGNVLNNSRLLNILEKLDMTRIFVSNCKSSFDWFNVEGIENCIDEIRVGYEDIPVISLVQNIVNEELKEEPGMIITTDYSHANKFRELYPECAIIM